MNPFACYRLHITPLSPIHIGTGESYQPTNYVIEDGALHEFDTGAAMAALSGADREALLRIASDKPDTRMLLRLQKYFFDRRNKLIWGVNCCPVAQGVSKIYSDRIGKAAQIESGGRIVVNELAIDRTGYNPFTRKPVLYGSSLKGAIRTALLDRANGGQRAYERQGLHEFQGRLLQYRAPENGRLHLELDPLRLVQLADAPWQDAGTLPAAEVHLAVNRKKHAVKDQSGELRKAMGENLYQILECVPALRYRSFAGQLNLQRVDGLRGSHALPAESLRFSVEALAHACNRFYLPLLNSERKLMGEQGFIDPVWNATLKSVLALTQDRLKTGSAFLLRVGRHSGAEAVTVSGARNGNIRIMKGKGQAPDYADAAKTLWLAAEHKDQRQNLLPFGWLLVEIEPLEQPARDWPELKTLCAPHLSAARAFAAKLESQRDAMAKTRAEAEHQRRAEEQQARQKAQAEAEAARQAAERQAQLATLSEPARQVEAFRERMEREGAQQWAQTGNGGGWFSDLKNLAQSAAAWLPDDKEALLAVLRELGQRDPRLAPKKNDGIKKLIRSLSA